MAEKLLRFHKGNPERLLGIIFKTFEDNPKAREELTQKIRELIAAIPERDDCEKNHEE